MNRHFPLFGLEEPLYVGEGLSPTIQSGVKHRGDPLSKDLSSPASFDSKLWLPETSVFSHSRSRTPSHYIVTLAEQGDAPIVPLPLLMQRQTRLSNPSSLPPCS